MNRLQTEILVIGGGATGTGILRDLAMRGFKALLVERSDLATGTTGRYHGLLHSGGRYVVKDPQAARECIEENRILRRIMPMCLEDTGGFFVVTPEDDPAYAPKFVEGCRAAGIPVEEVPLRQMLREEPLLNPRISRCFRVPDAAADSWLAADLNAKSAQEYGSQVLTYHRVEKLLLRGDKVAGAICYDLVRNEEVTILADFVINAAGAWAGQIAGSIGIKVQIVPGKGVMLAANHRILHTVVNRCKMPSDGDILVPIHTVTVIGTTDVKVSDPDHFAIEPWEVRLMLDEGDKLVPGFRNMRMLRAWAGVRPLYQETEVNDTRDITRAYVLLDHEKRDGISGLVTITSGKWTTYRKMAEETVNLVCEKLGVQRACRTHLEPLPGNAGHGYHQMGVRFAQVEKSADYGRLVCECELATIADVTQAIVEGQAKTIDDVRRDVRLGMGPCQGGFCTYRVTGLLHRLRKTAVEQANVALRDFMQERWKGLLPVLWGQQLRQERLNQLIYLSLLNADALPGAQSSRLSPEFYLPPEDTHPRKAETMQAPEMGQTISDGKPSPPEVDVLVIGAGLAGLVSAWQASRRGKRVRLISKGWGSLYWHSGCVDVLGYVARGDRILVEDLAEALQSEIQANPSHPYHHAGLEGLRQAIDALKSLCESVGYPLQGYLERNWMLPTALGTLRPTCLAPETMIAGDLKRPEKMLIVGFEGYLDFYPELIADNLRQLGVEAEGMTLEIASLKKQRLVTSRVLAEWFERQEFRSEVVKTLKEAWRGSNAGRIGFPAVLGFQRALEVKADLEEQLGVPVFEIPTLPPSIPGIRLHHLLVNAIEQNGGRVYDGMQVLSAQVQDGRVQAVLSEAAARQKTHRAVSFVLASGGILGGGTWVEPPGQPQETIFDLPFSDGIEAGQPVEPDFFYPYGHPVFRVGVRVNHDFQPLNLHGERVIENLYVAGGALGGYDPILERSLEGVALVSGFVIGNNKGL